ncbi:MAG: hypothetical protein WAN66_11225 [Limnoraphis robusta]|uniref:Uncharacterized protein n=1 Tax=Limnoraphis robusta CS-951 TaxID=1637645 RepID=A0A0F5YGE6_9CYAN|nr:hypothetical protein [Limnoraphis robusta]KKD37707.1 hypothetical protein WN50_12885 [Limnoraphis robusta CS-951]MEA5540819.1 hypothetical protein [Limnoraphis robusta Tam1]
MTAQSDRIKALILNIDKALSLSNPRPPLVVLGDSIIQSRQVLEQVRSYLLSHSESLSSGSLDIIPDSQPELNSLEQSLRLAIRQEFQQLQTQLTQTIQAEIQAMRQERRVLIRELRLLRQQRQQAETASQLSQEPQSPSPVQTVFVEPTATYRYPSSKERVQELFPYAGVELPPQQLESLVTSVAVSASRNPEPIATMPDVTLSQQLDSDQSELINLPSLAKQESSEETPTQNDPPDRVELELVAPQLEISPTLEGLQESTLNTTEVIVSLDPDSTPEENPLEISSEGVNQVNDVFGALDLREAVFVESQALRSPSVTLTQPTTPPDPIHQLLDQEGYIPASPLENLLPHDQQQEDDDDQLDTHLMVDKSIRQQLEEDLLNLEQQSFIGEDHTTPNFSNPLPTTQEIETFEQLWSETSPVELNPFAEASASEMNLDELLDDLDQNEGETTHPDEQSDDLNFEALNRKLQQ